MFNMILPCAPLSPSEPRACNRCRRRYRQAQLRLRGSRILVFTASCSTVPERSSGLICEVYEERLGRRCWCCQGLGWEEPEELLHILQVVSGAAAAGIGLTGSGAISTAPAASFSYRPLDTRRTRPAASHLSSHRFVGLSDLL